MSDKKDFPKGWQLKNEFVDEATGDVYCKGKIIERVDGSDIKEPGAPIEKAATPAEPPTEKPKETLTMQVPSESEIRMQHQINEMRKMLENMKGTPASINVKQERLPFGEYDDSAIEDKDADFMEKAVCYVMFGRGYSLSGYPRNGVMKTAPHNVPIYFKREFDEVTYHENYAKVIPFSRYTCNSKADSKFIEESPYFGTIIFRDYESVKNVDVEMVDKYEMAIISVQRMNDNELMAACVAKGIDVRQPKETLKHLLIKNLMKGYLDAEEQLSGARQENMRKELFEPPQS